MNHKTKKIVYFVGAFMIPVIVNIIVYAVIGIFPFGEKSIYALDLNNQYSSYFAYFREIARGNHGIFYTFSKTLGGDMIGLAAYYLMSPFNLILLLFPVERLPEAVEIITLLKMGACGLTFYYSISRENMGMEGWIFSSAYALMAYNLAYQTNLMWLDSVALFPLVVLGIQKILEKKTPFLYLAALFYAILCNYYIGYMICIFSALYFLVKFLLREDTECFWDGKIIRNYIGTSALAGGLAMWLLIPTYRSLEGGKASFDLTDIFSLQTNFHWSDFFRQLFIGGFDWEQIATGLPNVYCGFVCLLFAVIFFLTRGISRKKKLSMGILLLLLYLSFYFQGLDLIWHGLNTPNWFPYRYSFMFSFLLIQCAKDGYRAVRRFRLRALLVPLCLAELCVNSILILENIRYTNYPNYRQFVSDSEAAVQYVKEQDPGFYRLEKTFSRKECDPMLLDYRGLSHYSSTEKTAVKYFMGQMGFRNNGNWSYYNRGSTYAADSLLGVRYILTKEDKSALPYDRLTRIKGIDVYRNPFALPIGFWADDAVLSWDISNPHKFELQNELWKAICPDVEEKLFKPENIESVKKKNLEQSLDDENVYRKKNREKNAYIEYSFTASGDDPVFAYFGTNEMKKVVVLVNGKELGDYFDTYQYDIMRLGTFRQGEKVTVRLKLKEDDVNITDTWIYYQDMRVFEEYYQRISAGAFQVASASDTRIEGKVEQSFSGGRMLFTIPYENGWHVYIDGEQVRTEQGAGIFLSVQVPEGEHELILRYVPVGWKTGLLLTGISLLLLGIWIRKRQSRRRVILRGFVKSP